MPNEILELSVDDILLDPSNPRLDEADREKDQADLLSIMVRRYKLEELGAAISQIGFIEKDPLIGYRANGCIYVREGNRRIAALKLLRNPDLAPRSKQRTWRDFSNSLDDEKKKTFNSVRITVYDDITEADIDAYVGFRHVSGVLDWPPLEKARFIGDLISRHGWSYKYISDILGSRPAYVERNFVAYRLIDQAVDEGIDGADNITFGTLTRALQAGGVAEYLGLRYTSHPEDNQTPVPREKIENLQNFVALLFGNEDREPLIRESRDITKFASVLNSEEAVSYALTARAPTLERAWQKAGGEKESIADLLARIADDLEDVTGVIADYADVEKVRTELERAYRRMRTIAGLVPGLDA